MSKPNSFSTYTPLTAITSHTSSTSYTISSSLTSYFSRNLFQKDLKNPKPDPQNCLECSFFKNLIFLCKSQKNTTTSAKKTIRTQISTEDINFCNDRDFEEKKPNLMEFIEESIEFLGNSRKSFRNLMLNSISNSSIFTGNLMRNYPINEMFLYNNEGNNQWILTKICLEKNKGYKRGSFEKLKKIENIHKEILKKSRNRAISFVFDEKNSMGKNSRILDTFKQLDKKNVILDVSSDFSALKEFQKEFDHVLSIQSNFFVAKGLINEFEEKKSQENVHFIVADPLNLKGIPMKIDAIHLNFRNFNAKNLDQNEFLFDIAMKYTGFSEFLMLSLPSLVTIQQILGFFTKILTHFKLRIVYNLSKKDQNSQIYAIIQSSSFTNHQEEAEFFINHLTKSQENLINRENLNEIFIKLLEKIPLIKLLENLRILQQNFTQKADLLIKFLEILSINEGINVVFNEETKKYEFFKKKNEEILGNMKHKAIKYEESRIFSSYSNNLMNSEGEMQRKSLIINSESRPFLQNLINNKNLSSY